MSKIVETELGSLLDTIIDYRGKTPKKLKGEWALSGIQALSAKNIKRGKIVNPESIRFVDEDLYSRWMKQEVKRGDILMTSEAPLGETYYVKSDDKILLSQRLFALRTNAKKLDSGFLFYYFNSKAGNHELLSRATGTTVGGIRQTALAKVKVRYPEDTATQKQIASILFAYDDLIENNEKRIKALEEMASRLYTEWFVLFKFPGHEKVKMVDSGTEFGMVPEGWEVKRLGEIAKEIRESVNPKKLNPDTAYVGLEHIPRKTISLSDWGKASDVTSGKLKFRTGDILFGKIRPYFHKVVSAPVDGISSSDTVIIRANIPVFQPLVLMCVSSENFVAYATNNSQGTKMPRADWKSMSKYLILLPEEQILKMHSQAMNQTILLINALMFKSKNLSKMRDLLVPQLVTGEREVK